MLFNLLTANSGDDTMSWVVIVILIAAMVLLMVFSNRAQKKQAQKAQEMINAIRPGNKVKTIGGICGIVVEVNAEDNTFVLETGSEAHGKSFIKFDKQAIYQSDAQVETEEKKEQPAQEPEQEQATEEKTE